MDEIVKSLIVQAPLAAVVGIALWVVYRDGRADRQYMMDLLEKLYMRALEQNGERLSDHEETFMKRP